MAKSSLVLGGNMKILSNKEYQRITKNYDELMNKYYELDTEFAKCRLQLIEIRNVFDNKKLDTSDKRINRIKKIIRKSDKK